MIGARALVPELAATEDSAKVEIGAKAPNTTAPIDDAPAAEQACSAGGLRGYLRVQGRSIEPCSLPPARRSHPCTPRTVPSSTWW